MLVSAPLVEFYRYFSPACPAAEARIRQAVCEPVEYVREHRSAMRLRGIDGPVPALPLLVFVDELVDAGLACELDWREEPDAVLRAVASLRMASSGNDLPDDADVDVPDAADCEQTLAAIGRALEPYGVALIQLETNTDSYVVSCVALSDLPTLRERALTAGVRLEEVRVDRSPPGRWRIGGS